MTSSFKNVAIVGASGSIDNILLDGLFASSQFNITVVSRLSPNKLKPLFPQNVAFLKADLSNVGLEAAFKNQDFVISTVGSVGFRQHKKVVDAAVRAGVKWFILSNLPNDTLDYPIPGLFHFFREKTVLVYYLQNKEAEDLSWTAIAASGLFDCGLRNKFLEFDVANRTATIWNGGDNDCEITYEKEPTQSVISILQHPEEARNRCYYVHSVEITQPEMLAVVEKAQEAKWTIVDTTTDTQVGEASMKLENGDASSAFALIRATATAYGNTPDLDAKSRNKKTV
ncbi:uncharacterized protein N7503_007189 [Penicillium pulvis]|uniref:uncharacterized protein n=1 Tax=Penicillium pulvis TaxID=1562058 RepID=UPI0025484BEA|nr:uncharacterized protein N7503_007189 [Penicillium pulvis]KAJ5797893.1 hypothetical protein N7503_007189 [Penicillium pulvis]